MKVLVLSQEGLALKADKRFKLLLAWFEDPFLPAMILTAVYTWICLSFGILHSWSYYNGMVTVTQAHFLVAYFFTLTSSQFKISKNCSRLVMLTGLASFLSVCYWLNRRYETWFGIVYFYFIWHMLRDELWIRHPKQIESPDRILLKVMLTGLIVSMYVLLMGPKLFYFVFHGPSVTSMLDIMKPFTQDSRAQILPIAGIVFICFWLIFYHVVKSENIQLGKFYQHYRKILNVFASFYFFSLFACLLRIPAWFTLNGLIIFHVSSWYIYSLQKIQHSPKQSKTWKEWPRSGMRRFNMLYFPIQLIILVGFFCYLSRNNSGLEYFYDQAYFPIWTLFHITFSFLLKRD